MPTPPDFMPFLKFVPIQWKTKDVSLAHRKVDAFIKVLINEHKATLKPDVTRDFVDILLKNREKAGI